MQKIYFSFCLLITMVSVTQTTAQNPKLEITHEQTEKGYDFYAENQTQSPYLLKVTFNDLRNLRPSYNLHKEIMVNSGKQRIFTLKKERENERTNFNYKYTYRKGSLPVKLNPDFTYLIPLKQNRVTRTLKVVFVGEMLGTKEETPEDWYCVGFTMSKADTVVAARSGEVIEVKDDIDYDKSNLLMSQEMNYVEMLHKDGTIGKYQLFKKEGIFVEAGDKVIAGHPLGIIDSEHYEHGPHLRFQVYYAKKGGGYAYVPIKFHAIGQSKKLNYQETYKVVHPEHLIIAELSKRQKKKRKP